MAHYSYQPPRAMPTTKATTLLAGTQCSMWHVHVVGTCGSYMYNTSAGPLALGTCRSLANISHVHISLANNTPKGLLVELSLRSAHHTLSHI